MLLANKKMYQRPTGLARICTATWRLAVSSVCARTDLEMSLFGASGFSVSVPPPAQLKLGIVSSSSQPRSLTELLLSMKTSNTGAP